MKKFAVQRTGAFATFILLIVLALMPTAITHAAITWEKSYYLPRGGKMVQAQDSGYAVAGFTYAKELGGFSTPQVLKLDLAGNIQWNKLYRSANSNLPRFINPTTDGGFILCGNGTWVMKLDSMGYVQWHKIYKLKHERYYRNNGAESIVQADDGGFVLLAADSVNSIVSVKEKNSWIVKLDAEGNVEWQKLFRTSLRADVPRTLVKTSDGGYMVGAFTNMGNNTDVLLFKLDSKGEVLWQKIYGGQFDDAITSILELENGGFVIGGEMINSPYYPWTLKIDSDGNILWQKKYLTLNEVRYPVTLVETSDNGFMLAGSRSGLHPFLMKLDSSGENEWWASVGRGFVSTFESTRDGGYLLARPYSFLAASRLDEKFNSCSGEFAKSFATATVDAGFAVTETSISVRESNCVTELGNMVAEDASITEPLTFCVSAFPEIYVDSTALDYGFGALEIGETATETILVANEGGVDLEIDTVDIVGADAGQFGLNTNCGAVYPGGSCVIDVTFAPDTLGNKSATLRILSNAFGQTSIEITLSGEGVDTVAPEISITVDRNLLWPPNHKLVDVLIGGTASDNGSGIASVDVGVIDEYGEYDMNVRGFSNVVSLEAWRKGNDTDGRIYILTATATDKAGNSTTATTEVLVPHDMRK